MRGLKRRCRRRMDKAANYLGIMRKANAVAIGETDAGAAIKSGKAFILCLAADASDNAKKRANTFVYSRNTPMICLPYEKTELQQAFSKAGCSMFAITDLGLASAFAGALAMQDTALYQKVSDLLSEKLRARGSGIGKNGKRRKNV